MTNKFFKFNGRCLRTAPRVRLSYDKPIQKMKAFMNALPPHLSVKQKRLRDSLLKVSRSR